MQKRINRGYPSRDAGRGPWQLVQRFLWNTPLLSRRDQHWHTAAIVLVSLAMLIQQVTFLPLNSHQDIRRRSNSEYQVRHAHSWSGPEAEEPAHVERMPDDLVWSRCPELECFIFPSQQVERDLPQSEQVEMVNQKCGGQYQKPSKSKQR